jgi:integrase/recombinase XerC
MADIEPLPHPQQSLTIPAADVSGDQVERLVERFLAGRRPNTRAAYESDLRGFAAWALQLGRPARLVTDVETAEALRRLLSLGAGPANGLILDYLNQLRAEGLSAATVNRRLAALRALIKLARLLGAVGWTLEVPGEALEAYRDTAGPGLAAVRRLLGAIEGDGTKAARDRAVIRLLWDLGLRRGEVVSLDLEHLDEERGRLAVLGKRRSGREWETLPPESLAALSAWLGRRGSEPGPLFLNLDRAGKGSRLTTTSIYRMVRARGRAADVEVRPHGIRHSAITTVLDLSGGNVRAAQRFSRHKDLATLLRYDDSREDLAGQMARLAAAAL